MAVSPAKLTQVTNLTRLPPGPRSIEGVQVKNGEFGGERDAISSVELKLPSGKDFKVDSLIMSVNASRNDAPAAVVLTSPSGKSVEFSLKGGNGVDRSYVLSDLFKGEKANGTWTLTVIPGPDSEGKLNSWVLAAGGPLTSQQ